jgi:hypothetical protein
MIGRGFSDNIKIYGVRKLNAQDWVTGVILFLVGILFLWM